MQKEVCGPSGVDIATLLNMGPNCLVLTLALMLLGSAVTLLLVICSLITVIALIHSHTS